MHAGLKPCTPTTLCAFHGPRNARVVASRMECWRKVCGASCAAWNGTPKTALRFAKAMSAINHFDRLTRVVDKQVLTRGVAPFRRSSRWMQTQFGFLARGDTARAVRGKSSRPRSVSESASGSAPSLRPLGRRQGSSAASSGAWPGSLQSGGMTDHPRTDAKRRVSCALVVSSSGCFRYKANQAATGRRLPRSSRRRVGQMRWNQWPVAFGVRGQITSDCASEAVMDFSDPGTKPCSGSAQNDHGALGVANDAGRR